MQTTYFKRYTLENPATHEIRSIDKRTYVLAGLLGSPYVLFSGFFGRFFLAVIVDVVMIGGGILAGLIAKTFIGGGEIVIVIAAIIAAVPIIRSVPLVQLIKSGYRRRGWDLMRQ